MANAENKTLPHRFRETQFRRYELAIASVVERFPNITRFTPEEIGLSAVTFACRFRDACASFFNHSWTSDTINRTKFNTIYQDMVVSERGHEVWVGSAEMLKAPPVYSIEAQYLGTPLPINAGMFSPFSLLAYLSHNRLLQPVLITDLSDAAAQQLLSEYDINLVKTPQGYVLS